jgi:hypothetical protein
MPHAVSAAPARCTSARREALDEELWIDVDEWCETHAIAPLFPYPAAMTHALCDAIETLPFREIGRSSAAERGLDVLQRARAALERALAAAHDTELARGFATEFCAPLRRSAAAPGWLRLSLRCSAAESAKPELSLGLAGEL